MQRLGHILRGVFPIALLLILWALGTTVGKVNPLVLPPLGDLARSLLDPQVQHDILNALQASSVRLLEGGAIGVAAGLVFGGLLGLSPFLDRVLGPTFHGFRQIAIFAWIPLLTAWFGVGDMAKIIFIAIGAFKPATMGAYEGFRNVPVQYVEVGRALCFSPGLMLRRIVLPSSLPSIVTGIQLAFIFAWLGTIGSEYLIGSLSEGIGSFVMAGREMLRTDLVFVGIIIIAIIGLLMNKTLKATTQYLFPWYQQA